MAVELLISPPASGKTEACVGRIRGLLLERPLAPVRVVLPDRLQTAAFRRRLAEAGGAIGAQVGTFGDLYRDLLDRAARPIPAASPPVVHRLVQAAIRKVDEAGGLRFYAGLRETPGFALTLRDVFAELKRALVFPEDFMRQAAEGGPARQELALLYLAYQDQLRAAGWADPEGLSWLAVEALQNDPALAGGLDLLVVDGFDSFNGAQLQTLQLLAHGPAEILITLPGVLPFRRAAHRRFESAYQALVSRLPAALRSLPARTFLPAPLQHIEAALFEPEPAKTDPGAHLQLIEARSPAEEAREALRWLKARIVRDEVPLHSCTVIAPDPGLYHAGLRLAAAEFGLPLRFTLGETLAQSPEVSALLGLVDLPAQNYPRRPLLDAIRSPFFDLSACGLGQHSADLLDEVSRYGQVIEGRGQWDEVFERLAQAPPLPELEGEEELRAPGLPRGRQADALHQALRRFFDRLSPPDGLFTLTEWVRWLEDLLDEWRFDALASEGRSQAAVEQFHETLRALVAGEAVTGAQAVSYAGFAAELRGALEGAAYQEPLPGGGPAVLVTTLLEARGLRFQAAAVLGLSEGIFPAVERADPFLAEDLRQSLGLEPRLQREQAGLFYHAVTRSGRFLLLTRPYLAGDGEKWEPSPFWKAALALLPEQTVQVIRPDDPRPLEDAASAQEVLFWAARRRSLPQTFADLQPRWEYILHAARMLRARLAEHLSGPNDADADALAGLMQQRYGGGHVWSPSRLEAYGACPHQFFVRYALELEAKPPPSLGLDAARLGTLLHAILERAYAAAQDPADPDSVLAAMRKAAGQMFERAPLELGFRPSLLWQAEQDQLLLALETTIRGLAEEDAASRWRPAAFELPFGQNGAQPLAIQLDGQTILLHGVVDRVDRSADGRLRIIDYKTGSSHLEKQDLTFGRRLQLPLYALAVEDVLGMGRVAEGFYWALLKGVPGGLKLSSYKWKEESGPPAAAAAAREHLSRIVENIRQARFAPAPPKGGCPNYCPAAAWCWRYTPGWGA